MNLKTALALTLAALAGACSSTSTAPDASVSDAAARDTIMSAAGYDRSCAANQDCVAVFEGNVCGCGCNYASLNKGAAAKYGVDSAAKRSNCKEIFNCEACASAETACVASVCQVVKDAGAGDSSTGDASADAAKD